MSFNVFRSSVVNALSGAIRSRGTMRRARQGRQGLQGFFSSTSVLTETQVYAAGSEDMDTLTFNAPILYRHLTFSEAKKAPISEINLQKALEGFEMDMSQVRSIHAPLFIWN